VQVAEEHGKININLMRRLDDEVTRQKIYQMLRLIDLLNTDRGERPLVSYSLLPAIMDWIDGDDDVTIFPFIERENAGAERTHYESLPSPYTCKNAPFDTLEELLLVKGMTREIFYGVPGDETAGIKPAPGMCQFLTIYGDGKISINDAPAEVLQSLSDNIDAALAGAIVEQRGIAPFASTQELLSVPGMTGEIYAEIRGLITIAPASRYFRITATGLSQDLSRTVQVVAKQEGGAGRIRILLRKEL
jgi:general secretion pathway protein K